MGRSGFARDGLFGAIDPAAAAAAANVNIVAAAVGPYLFKTDPNFAKNFFFFFFFMTTELGPFFDIECFDKMNQKKTMPPSFYSHRTAFFMVLEQFFSFVASFLILSVIPS